MAVPNSEAVQWLPSGSTSAESRSGRIGPIILEAKQTEERSAGNPHAAFDESREQKRPFVDDPLRAAGDREGVRNDRWHAFAECLSQMGECRTNIRGDGVDLLRKFSDQTGKKRGRVFRRSFSHLPRARNRQGFGWARWSRGWLYQTLKLFNGYRVVDQRRKPLRQDRPHNP